MYTTKRRKYFKNYTPHRTGELEKSLTFVYKNGVLVALLYNIDYAKKVWYGNENWSYNTRINRQACPRWTERAWNVHQKDIMNNVQRALKKNV